MRDIIKQEFLIAFKETVRNQRLDWVNEGKDGQKFDEKPKCVAFQHIQPETSNNHPHCV